MAAYSNVPDWMDKLVHLQFTHHELLFVGEFRLFHIQAVAGVRLGL